MVKLAGLVASLAWLLASGAACSGGGGDDRCGPVDDPTSEGTRLVIGESYPYSLLIDGDELVWVTLDAGVRSAPLSGGCAEVLVVDSPESTKALIHDGYLYWQEYVSDGLGYVRRIPRGGGDVEVLYEGAPPSAFAIGGELLYVALDESLVTVPLAGGATQTIATGFEYPGDLLSDGTYVYLLVRATIGPNGQLYRYNLDGTEPLVLAEGLYSPSELVLAGDTLYWVEEGVYPMWDRGAVGSVPRAGGTPTVLAADLIHPDHLAVDDSGAYVSLASQGSILHIALAGGTPSAIVTGQSNITSLALDSESLYWTDSFYSARTTPATAGWIGRIAKP